MQNPLALTLANVNKAGTDEQLSDIVAVMVGVSVEGPYSYRVPPGMAVTRGSIVAVPLVGRLTLGVVWGAPTDNFAHNRLKDIEIVYDVPPLSRRTAEDGRLGVALHAGAARAWCCARCCARPRRWSPSGR